jgi:hypothetical protein
MLIIRHIAEDEKILFHTKQPAATSILTTPGKPIKRLFPGIAMGEQGNIHRAPVHL